MAVMRVRSPLPVALSIEEGSHLSLLRTTAGKLLLAFTDKHERQDILRRSELFRGMNHKRQKDLCALLKRIQSHMLCITTALAEAMDEHKYLRAAKDCAEEINRAIGIEPRWNGANGL